MSTPPALKAVILTNDITALTALLSPLGDPLATPLSALTLSAQLARPLPFSHLLTLHPALQDSFSTEPLLLAALDGGSVPIWRVILEHRPISKDQRFGHYGNVIERCVSGGKVELLEFLLGEGAKVEMPGRPILLRAEVEGAREEVKEMLRRFGARDDGEED